jgi:hypothetical protein
MPNPEDNKSLRNTILNIYIDKLRQINPIPEHQDDSVFLESVELLKETFNSRTNVIEGGKRVFRKTRKNKNKHNR